MPRLFTSAARSFMSASVHPGWAEIKYGINSYLRSFFTRILSKRFLSFLNNSNGTFRIDDKTCGEMCSGATFSLPETCLVISSSRYSPCLLYTSDAADEEDSVD